MSKLLFGPLTPAVFVARDNRFRATVLVAGQAAKAHVPNSGRMAELLTAGAAVWVRPAGDPGRKTAYDLLLVDYQGRLVCLNAHLANSIFRHWLEARILPEFADVTAIRSEYRWGGSRFDFCLTRADGDWLVEVKSVNLALDGLALFPDAPTDRGARHVRELTANQRQGGHSAVVFVVMGNQARAFAPNTGTDPAFAQALAAARAAGVAVWVYTCDIALDGVAFGGAIPWKE